MDAPSPDRLMTALQIARDTERSGKYDHWDKIRRMPGPPGFTHEEWWAGLKMHRTGSLKLVPLADKEGRPFSYSSPDMVLEGLHDVDLGAGGTISVPDPLLNPQTKNQYLVRSLIQEAITSSQLEGAAVTREVAKDMIRSGRSPTNKGEQMILNNYLTMQLIRSWKDRPLDPDLVFEIHRAVTHDTLDNPAAAGRLRPPSEDIRIEDEMTGETLHVPPEASELKDRLDAMCRFANSETPDHFVHPVVRAILLHFWLAYDHPFVDGNGRTARALFYWFMLRHSYWLFEFISISEIILKAPAKYARAFLYTETDDNDLTYFLVHQMRVIKKAIKELHSYIDRKASELAATEAVLRTGHEINHRQQALVAHALRHPNTRYTVQAHQESHKVVYETARRDLLELEDLGWLIKRKSGKGHVFIAPSDLGARVQGSKEKLKSARLAALDT